MIYILVCARARDSAWGMERGGGGGGGNWSQRAAFRMNGGGAAAPPEPMLDPGLRMYTHIHTYLNHPFLQWLCVLQRSLLCVWNHVTSQRVN